jgi:hypothetical protein
MNYFEAHELLERVKHGHRPPIGIINKALCLTGDLCFTLCEFSDDEGVARLHAPTSQGTKGFKRNVGRPTPFGEGTH